MRENLQLALNLMTTLAIVGLASVLMRGTSGTPTGIPPGTDHGACTAKIAQLEMETDILMGQIMKLQIEARAHRRDFTIHVQTLRALGLVQTSPDFMDMGSTDEGEETAEETKKQ